VKILYLYTVQTDRHTNTNPVYTTFFVHNLNVESLSSLSLLVYKQYPIHAQCAGTLLPCQISRLHRMAHRVSTSTENLYRTAAMLWSYILQNKLKTVGTAQSVWCLGYELHETGFIFWHDKGFSLLRNVQTGSGAHPASYSMDAGSSFTGNKAAGARN